MDDVHGTRRAEHGDLAGGPRVVEVRANRLGSHHDVGAAVGLAHDHGDERHLRVRIRVDHLRAAADDAGVLLLGARFVPGRVDQGDDGQIERVAQTHEARHLLR